jgi:dienelactone hydrolase
MRDVRDAFVWARTQLSSLKLHASPYLQIDNSRVAVVGWSTGGTLALTLGWTPDVKAPDAILSFYCPTDYEDPCKCYAAIPFAGGEEYRTNLNSRLASTQLSQ